MKNISNLRKTFLTLSLAAITAPVYAADEKTQQLEQRVDQLEKIVQDQNKTILQQTAKPGENDSSIEWSAVVEVEAGFVSPETGDSESDVAVATVELGAALNLTDSLSGEIILLFEEDETDLEIDVAQLNYAFGNSGFSATLGQIYVPFGAYETALISDTLTLELGETRESILGLNYEANGFGGSVYVFNGDANEVGSSTIDNFGFSVGYGNDNFAIGASYINSLGDSDLVQDVIGEAELDSYTDGFSINGSINFGNFTAIAEYTTALDNFGSELEFAEPSATNLEFNLGGSLFGKDATYAVAYQTTDDALILELPETRFLVGLGVDVNDHFSIGVEYARDSDYDLNDGGSGEDTDAVVIQFAASL